MKSGKGGGRLVEPWAWHTSVRHSPGVVIRNPSSPCGMISQEIQIEREEETHISCIWSYAGVRPQMVLKFLSNDFLVDVEVWKPVSVHAVVVGHSEDPGSRTGVA